jgi:hypothetical protein
MVDMFNRLLITTATLECLKVCLVLLVRCLCRRPIQRAIIMTQTGLSMTPTGHLLMSVSVLATIQRHHHDMPRLHNLAGVNTSRSHQDMLIILLSQRYSTHTQSLVPIRPKPQPRLRHCVLYHNPCMVLRHLCSKRSITRGEEMASTALSMEHGIGKSVGGKESN